MQDKAVKVILRRTPESEAMVASVKRAMAATAVLNRLSFGDANQIRSVFSDLIGCKVDDSFMLMPPFYATGGENTRIGCRVFINQNCTMYDLGGIDIADDVMIGPNVSLITSSHPIEPSRRRDGVIAKPIQIEKKRLARRWSDSTGRCHNWQEFSSGSRFGSDKGRAAQLPGWRKSREIDTVNC